MLKLFLWLRYLRKKRIVLLSITAVALSVALLIVVASLFTGFIEAFERSAVETIGDVVVAPPVRFTHWPSFIQLLEKNDAVAAATATLSSKGLLHTGEGNVRAVDVWGIDPARRVRVTGFKQTLLRAKSSVADPSFQLSGMPEKVGGFVGIGVVAEPDEKTDEYDFNRAKSIIGQQVVLTTGTIKTENEQQSIKRKLIPFTVADIVFTGVYELDKSFVYLPIKELQKVLYPHEDKPLADQIQIKLAGDTDSDVAMAQIRGLWADFADKQLRWPSYLIQQTTITTAKQLQSKYVAELRKQMGLLLLIFGVVSFSVVVLIFCIFYMIVETCQKDVAIMKSCGAASSSVTLIFVGFGGCVGVIGSGLGMILGVMLTKNINTIEEWIRIIFGLKLWKSSVYVFSRIPSQVDWDSVGFIVLSAVIAAAIGALIPAIIAARTRPVNILRYE
jgi:lipoprotein-releasing system permease protein